MAHYLTATECSQCGRKMKFFEDGWFAHGPKVMSHGAELDVRCPDCAPENIESVVSDEMLVIGQEVEPSTP